MRSILVLTVCLSISTVLLAAEPASLATAGSVWTNSILLPSGGTLHKGDRVKTDRASSAVISSRSTGRVEVREQSSVSVGDGEVVLHEGVVTTAQAPIRLDGVEIRPHGGKDGVEIRPHGGKDALIVVAKRGEQTLIAAHRGAAMIHTSGLAPILVQTGRYAIPASSGGGDSKKSQAKTSDGEQDDTRNDGTAVPAGSGTGSQSPGWTVGSLNHGESVALLAGIGAAAVGGTIAGLALVGDPPSPSTQ